MCILGFVWIDRPHSPRDLLLVLDGFLLFRSLVRSYLPMVLNPCGSSLVRPGRMWLERINHRSRCPENSRSGDHRLKLAFRRSREVGSDRLGRFEPNAAFRLGLFGCGERPRRPNRPAFAGCHPTALRTPQSCSPLVPVEDLVQSHLGILERHLASLRGLHAVLHEMGNLLERG